MKQHTLKESFSLKGKGLHTGLDIEIKFNPAPENHGYKIKRIDLPEQPVIEALAENVKSTHRGTVLSKNDVKVSTVEHALAALYAYEIDNCLIEVNAPEFPILDGSAIVYADEIERVGREEQDAEREYYIVKNKIEVRDDATGSSILVLPDDGFGVNVHIAFDSQILDNQFAILEHLKDFKKEIAASRTFVFVREVSPLLQHGLIKGGDLDNAIVIYERQISQEAYDKLADTMGVARKNASELGYIMNKPLVFPNEPARHKLLDILGDIALIGKPIVGRILATCPGHKINNQFARIIRKDIKMNEVQAPLYNPNLPPLLDINRIKELLPHRYPFLLVEKILEIGSKHIIGVKNVSFNEPFFQGHFPGLPVMPGVLIMEALAQAGGLMVLAGWTQEEREGKLFLFTGMENVRFRTPVSPGDRLDLECALIRQKLRLWKISGKALVNGKLAAEGELTAAIMNREDF